MKRFAWGIALACVLVVPLRAETKINPTDPQPTCEMCPGTYIPLSELESYTKKALAEKLLDQQVRDIDLGKARIGIGMVHPASWTRRGRTRLPSTTRSARSIM